MSSATPKTTEKISAGVEVPRRDATVPPADPPSLVRGPRTQGESSLDGESEAGFQRIDRAHVPTIDDIPPDASQDGAAEAASPDRQQWLSLHASELIDRLQSWASDLDAREAQLNARTALQDHRERQFRLQQQDVAAELAEQKRAVERLRGQLQAQARRLAFQQ